MSIDTENKRRAVQAYTLGVMRPVPDGTIGVADRATVTFLYVQASAPPAATGPQLVHLHGGFGRHSLGGKGYSQ